MEHITIGKKYSEGKIAKIECIENGSLNNIEIKAQCFLLIFLSSGCLKFKYKGDIITAKAPTFICFDESENPVLLSKSKAKYHCIYFHPDFLNVNMSFELLRSAKYDNIAQNHDMFMLKPFLDKCILVPVTDSFAAKIENICYYLTEELELQRDWYWSCRGRSYFMEMIILLERMYGILGYGTERLNPSFSLENQHLKSAVMFIESNYAEQITLAQISAAANLNHSSLTNLFRENTGYTVMEYLMQHRIQISKKQLEFTSVPIKDIAKRIGFKTVQHFNRVFTKIVGETPAAFRKNSVQKRKDEIK